MSLLYSENSLSLFIFSVSSNKRSCAAYNTVIIDSNIDSTNGFVSGYLLLYHVLNIDPTVSIVSKNV